MIEVLLIAYTLQTQDPRVDNFCRDARAVAHIIGERHVIANAYKAGVPQWKLQKTLECFNPLRVKEFEDGRY